MSNQYYVYILANKYNNVLYTGVTKNLKKRVFEHREKIVKGFTEKYNISKLVYYESTPDIKAAITREKQIKGGSKADKVMLIEHGEFKL